jgi:hypothetical protein
MAIQMTKAKTDLNEYIQYWMGLVKIGKTKTASEFPSPLFIFTESGSSDKAMPHWTPDKWNIETQGGYIVTDGDDYDKIIIELLDIPLEKRPKTLILDTVDGFVAAGANSIMRDAKTDSLNEGALSYGRGTEKLTNWILEKIGAFQKLGMGIIFISHMVEKTINSANKEPVTVWRDTLPDKYKPIIHGIVDWIWHFTKEGKQRVILTQGDVTIEGGSRITLPDRIPMGKDSKTAYQNILTAFYGRNTEPDKAKAELVTRILKGEAYLAEKKIDGFEVAKRKENSRLNHLKSPDLELNDIDTLNNYYLHLQEKAKGEKNGTA